MQLPPQSALIKIGIAIVIFILAGTVRSFSFIGIIGAVLSVWGTIEWAKAKGLSPWFGLLGFFCVPFGWIAMLFIPNKGTSTTPV